MMECKCARCGEEITKPYFFKGAPFGWTCIKIVNPFAKKKKAGTKEHWIVFDSHDFASNGKQLVTAFWNGRKFKFWIFTAKTYLGESIHSSLNPNIELGLNGEIYYNIASHKSFPQILNPPTATVTVKE